MLSPGLSIPVVISNRLFASKRRMRLSPRANIGVSTPPPAARGEGPSKSSVRADSPTKAAVSRVPGSPRPLMVVLTYRGNGSSDTVTFTYSRQPSSSLLGKAFASSAPTAPEIKKKRPAYALICWPRARLDHESLEQPPHL
jgi:hypothetical protein